LTAAQVFNPFTDDGCDIDRQQQKHVLSLTVQSIRDTSSPVFVSIAVITWMQRVPHSSQNVVTGQRVTAPQALTHPARVRRMWGYVL
jgi:hypothetical protein